MIPHAPARDAKYAFQPYVCTILARGTPALAAPAERTHSAQRTFAPNTGACLSVANSGIGRITEAPSSTVGLMGCCCPPAETKECPLAWELAGFASQHGSFNTITVQAA